MFGLDEERSEGRDMDDIVALCEAFDLGDGDNPTIAGQVGDRAQVESQTAAGVVAFIENEFLTSDHDAAVKYRNFLDGFPGFHGKFAEKLAELERLSTLLDEGDRGLEEIVCMAVHFFNVPDASVGETGPPLLLKDVTERRHLPVPIADSVDYRYTQVPQSAASLGLRLFNSICPPDAFAKSGQERFAHGSSGSVFLGTAKSDPADQVAIKETISTVGPAEQVAISETNLHDTAQSGSTTAGTAAPDIFSAFFREILCLLVSAHPAILDLLGWNITPDDLHCQFRHVTTFAPGHLMGSVANTMRDDLSPTMKVKLAYGVARGMKNLHRLSILHRDLKPANILIDRNGHPRIADFSVSKPSGTRSKQSGSRGTHAYMAPEVLRGDRYGFPADVYSYGVWIAEMMSGQSRAEFINEHWATDNLFDDALRAGETHPDVEFCRKSQPKLCELLEGCFLEAEQRPWFADIVQKIEAKPEMFGVNRADFLEYKLYLDGVGVPPRDDDLMYLLRGLKAMDEVAADMARLPAASPFVERILLCLGRMFGPEHADDVKLVARYQFACKGCLDGPQFIRELNALQAFPPDRPKFPLAQFLIDPDQPLSPDRVLTVRRIANRNDLFAVLKTILVGLCFTHRYLQKCHGWNVRKVRDQFEILVVTDRADQFRAKEFGKWDAETQRRFVWSAAAGLAALHSRGVCHANLSDERSICVTRLEDGSPRAQICNFGLARPESLSQPFVSDTTAFSARFVAYKPQGNLATAVKNLGQVWEGPWWHSFEAFLMEHCLDDIHPVDRSEFYDELARSIRYEDFPLDLLFHLIRSPDLWVMNDDAMDLPGALAELTRGLDGDGKKAFSGAVNASLEANGCLNTGFFG
jgi:hypothetical protein